MRQAAETLLGSRLEPLWPIVVRTATRPLSQGQFAPAATGSPKMKSSITATSFAGESSGPSATVPYSMRTRAAIGSVKATPRKDSPLSAIGTAKRPSERPATSK